MEKTEYIGKSLSFCVQQIADGIIDYDDVLCIVANTRAKNEYDFAFVLNRYSASYWKKNPIAALKIAMRLWDEGKIIQPRIFNNAFCNNINDGIWIEVEV